MKKLLITTFAIGLFASPVLAAELATVLTAMGGSTSLSSGVSGAYFTDATQAQFVIQTKNAKGTKIYTTGSATSKIYVDDCAADPCAAVQTADFLQADPADFAVFTAYGTQLGGS